MKIQRSDREPNADTCEIIKQALDQIVTAKLSRNENGCLITVRKLSFLIANQVGICLDRNLIDCVDSLLEQDKRAKVWGYGNSNVKKTSTGERKYKCRSARIFQLRRRS